MMANPANPGSAAAIARRFCRNRLAVAGLVVIVVLALIALLTPVLAPEPLDVRADVPNRYQKPSWEHPLGTDNIGRDALSRLMWASRVSLGVGFFAMLVSVCLGVTVGAIAGFFAGRSVDMLLMRLAEAIDVIPVLFLLIMVVALVDNDGLHVGSIAIPQIYLVTLIIGLTSWPSLAQIVRGQFLSLRQRLYVEAARAAGAGQRRLIWQHILPNASAPIIVNATLRVGGGILAESGLSFLGLGTQPPNVSWGQLLANGKNLLLTAPWLVWPPGLAIVIAVMAFNFVGDGLRDALDPKTAAIKKPRSSVTSGFSGVGGGT